MEDLKIAAAYGLVPNRLGRCGVKSDNQTFYKFLSGDEIEEGEIIKALQRLKAACCYYELIARANGLIGPEDDFNVFWELPAPVREKVFKAYWYGDEKLFKNITTESIRAMIREKFSEPKGFWPKELALKKAEEIPEGAKPDHSFHVFIAGPFRPSGKGDERELKILDLCRISWGRIIDILENKIKVISRPLLKKDGVLFLGNEMERGTGVKWDEKIVRLDKGDLISFHWNQVVGRITEGDAKNLERFTRYTLNLL